MGVIRVSNSCKVSFALLRELSCLSLKKAFFALSCRARQAGLNEPDAAKIIPRYVYCWTTSTAVSLKVKVKRFIL